MSLLDKMLEDQENAHEDSYGDQDEFWNYGEDKKYKIVESEMYDQRRWVTVYRDVVTHEDFPDEYVAVRYERGSTEMQEADHDNTFFERVFPKEVTVIQYIAPKEKGETKSS